MSKPAGIIYVAGPFRGPTAWAVEQNIRRAEEWILPLALAGFTPLCVHSMFRFLDKTLPDQAWLDIALHLMATADAVLRIPGDSRGADEEVRIARLSGTPVVAALGPPSVEANVKAAVALLRANIVEAQASELGYDPVYAALTTHDPLG